MHKTGNMHNKRKIFLKFTEKEKYFGNTKNKR